MCEIIILGSEQVYVAALLCVFKDLMQMLKPVHESLANGSG